MKTYARIPDDLAAAAAAFVEALRRHDITCSSIQAKIPPPGLGVNIELHTAGAVEGDPLAFHHAIIRENHGGLAMNLHGVPTADAREAFAADVVAKQREAS